jgi:hypothetical protein
MTDETEIDLRAVAEQLRRIADRHEIHQVLLRYARGVDRGDAAMIASVYHDGAVDPHGPHQFGDPKTELAELAVSRLDALAGVAQHHITNCLIDLDGDRADVESYVIAYNPTRLPDGSEVLSVIGARWLDRFERRDNRWGLAARNVVIDWSRKDIPGEAWPDARHYPGPGRREADPSHEHFRRDGQELGCP